MEGAVDEDGFDLSDFAASEVGFVEEAVELLEWAEEAGGSFEAMDSAAFCASISLMYPEKRDGHL